MTPLLPVGPASTAVFWSSMYFFFEIVVAPVLQDDVDLAGAEALPGDLLLEVLLRHLAAELVLGDVARRRRRWPRSPTHGLIAMLNVPHGLPPPTAARRPTRLDRGAAAAGERQRAARRAATAPARDRAGRVVRRPLVSGTVSFLLRRCLSGGVVVGARHRGVRVRRRRGGLGDPVEHDAEQRRSRARRRGPCRTAGPGRSRRRRRSRARRRRPGRRRRPWTARRSGPGWWRGSSACARHRQLHLGDHLPGARPGGRRPPRRSSAARPRMPSATILMATGAA